MRRTPRRVTRQSKGTGRRVLVLSMICSVFGSLLLLAGCGASGASVPNPGGTAATCPAARAAIPTMIASTPTAAPGSHLSYYRLALGPLPRQLVYHPGATVHILWCALSDRYLVTRQPVPETLTFGFIGPFPTRAAAQADQLRPSPSPPPALSKGSSDRFPPPGPVIASTIPIHTTTWSGADASALLTLPTTLAPGYYVYFAQDDVSVQACLALASGGCPGNGGMSGIVQITRA